MARKKIIQNHSDKIRVDRLKFWRSLILCGAFSILTVFDARAGAVEEMTAADTATTTTSKATAAKTDGSRAPAGIEAGRNPNGPNAEDEEYNFSWLDPDKKVYVLQNRKYRKASRFAIFLQGGLNLSNPYRTEYFGMPRASYWFTEQFGVEVFYAAATNSDNTTLTALKNVGPSVLPYVREIRSFYGALATWTPWYSKLNFFNKILYFDWFFNLGLGQVNTALDQNVRVGQASNFKTETQFALYYGTGMDFYINRNFLVRLDLVGMMFNAEGADRKSRTTFNYDFAAGIGYLF